MPALMPRKVCALRDLRDSVWRVQFISEDPDLVDEVYQALKLKADKAATAVNQIKVEKLEIVLTWPDYISYNAADSWVYQGLKINLPQRSIVSRVSTIIHQWFEIAR